MRLRISKWFILVYLFFLTGQMAEASISQCKPIKGQLTSLEGSVEIGYGGTDWQPGKLESPLCEDDSIRVGANSRAAISLIGDVVLRLDQNTTVRLVDLTEKKEDRSVIELIKGALQSLSRSPRKLAINTPYINGMIEGTEFLTRVEPGRADITVFEGKVIAQNKLGSLPLTHGMSAEAKPGQAPQPRIVVRPRDAVQWALYYPPVLDLHPDQFTNTPDWQGHVRHSIEAYQAGNLKQAFDRISAVPDTVTDSRFISYRAALLLSVGRVDKAHSDIDNLLRRKPNDGNALALQTIIKVVQNQESSALETAKKAAQASPNSPSVLMALSYAQQAVFDLEGAKKTVEKITILDPRNALAWARLSELHASFGELEEALKTARKGTELKPDLSRTQTVLGFSQLMQIDTRQARESFQKAIESAPSDPLPRLGLGLAKIREGNLEEGRRDLEIAAGLDPNNAIVRSYLGKAYYEEKRADLTDREYETAEELDPNDPTPYFYDAIEKQTTNRPVEALQSAEKAIELNNNRAVYRSRLLLDSDLAARSSSLARIYNDLGFQKRALVEGWTSVNTDPSNFSAHRFLADSYSTLPRHSIARVSELLQSQLLQPINSTPIQARLAESNLFLIGSQGAGGLSFNEFNPIFNRDGYTLQTTGIIGENNTYGGEGVLSGIYKNASFNLAYSHFDTDGVRVNNDLQDDIANSFFQMELSPSTSIMGEYRHRETDRGDTQTRFLPSDISKTARFERDSDIYRIGARHAFSPNNIVLATAVHTDLQENQRDVQFPSFCCGVGNLTNLIPHETWGGEMQHLFRSPYFDLTSGLGYQDSTANFSLNFKGVFPGFGPFEVNTGQDVSTQHFNAYSYGNIKPLSNLTLTVGVSYDNISGDSEYVPENGNFDKFNPKVGLLWNPLKGTTVRAAWFREIKRALAGDQTLEPTQVGGFNQFYDDFDFTEAYRYGLGIDQKFTRQLFGGVEFSRRELKVPSITFDGNNQPVTDKESGFEYLGRAYLNWSPHDWLAFSADYFYEKFDNADTQFGGVNTPVTLETQRVPLSARFFHPSGISLGFTSTYIDQNGQFLPQGAISNQSGSGNFWLFDALVSYRLPKRYGFISLAVTNLTDNQFNYFEVDEENQFINPGRSVVGRVTLAIP